MNQPNLSGLHPWTQGSQDPTHRKVHFAACTVRKLLLHPTKSEEQLNKQDQGIVQEAWTLTHLTGRLVPAKRFPSRSGGAESS